MSRANWNMVLAFFAMFVLTSVTPAFGQSGSRGLGGAGGAGGATAGGGGSFGGASGASGATGSIPFRARTERRPRLTPEQQLQIQQQNALQQQAIAEEQRLRFLKRLQINPNSNVNRSQLTQAYNDAKAEFMAIRNGTQFVSGGTLQRPFLLRAASLDRKQRKINWPEALLEEEHDATIQDINGFVKDMNNNVAELKQLIATLSLQIEKRVIDKTISIKEYASAKRFLSGLANETDL